jgi:hypothetical protein
VTLLVYVALSVSITLFCRILSTDFYERFIRSRYLGFWQLRAEKTAAISPASSGTWSASQVYPAGSEVLHNGFVFVAKGDTNTAEPGSLLQQFFHVRLKNLRSPPQCRSVAHLSHLSDNICISGKNAHKLDWSSTRRDNIVADPCCSDVPRLVYLRCFPWLQLLLAMEVHSSKAPEFANSLCPNCASARRSANRGRKEEKGMIRLGLNKNVQLLEQNCSCRSFYGNYVPHQSLNTAL